MLIYDEKFEVDDDALLGDALTRDAADLLMQAAMAVNAAGGAATVFVGESELEDLVHNSEIDDA